MKIQTVLLKYDYGKKERGESLEKIGIFPGILKAADEVIPFWIEDNGYPYDMVGLQKNILEFTEKTKPDIIIFILMEYEISLNTIEELSKKYITVNWFCDDHWRFDDYTRFVAPKLTYSITTDKYSLDKYNKLGIKNVILSQWATHEYVDNLKVQDVDYEFDVSFIGGRNVTREWYVSELRKCSINIECFGAGWPNGRLPYDKLKQVFLKSKINLNLSDCIPADYRMRKYLNNNILKTAIGIDRKKYGSYYKTLKRTVLYKMESVKSKKRVEQINGRTFEIPGSGGFQLGQFALEIEDYFIIGKEIALFSNIDELKRQIKYYLTNDSERKTICENGYNRTKDYTYENRFKEILAKIAL